MSETVIDDQLTTADIANSPRPTNIANATGEPAATDRDPEFPDLRKDTVTPATKTAAAADTNGHAAIFPDNEVRDLRGRWDNAQSLFVDEPRKAVQEADSLVAATVKRVAELFADERAKMEKQWDRGDDVSTEDLRQALKRYRSFFDRLLTFQ